MCRRLLDSADTALVSTGVGGHCERVCVRAATRLYELHDGEPLLRRLGASERPRVHSQAQIKKGE
eukprot:714550-Pleurochrysis_carterae.AAC.1